MTNRADPKRIDSATRVIKASQQTIYKACIDPEAWLAWLPPKGMIGQIYEFDARNGGTYRMSLTYVEAEHAVHGKTTENTDVVQGRFLELVPDERIVQLVEFESNDPMFAGAMTMIWTFSAVPGGTEVSIICENVPEGIRQEDHIVGLKSSLENLSIFVEKNRLG